MGTNYYLSSEDHKNVINDKLHIGKSGVGCDFILHTYSYYGINDELDFLKMIKMNLSFGYVIKDEYGYTITFEMLRNIIFGTDKIVYSESEFC